MTYNEITLNMSSIVDTTDTPQCGYGVSFSNSSGYSELTFN